MIILNAELRANLSKGEIAVIEYINNHEQKIIDMSIIELADNCFTSTATVSRAIKKVNYSGLNELRYELSKKDNAKIKEFNLHDIIYKSQEEVNRTMENFNINDLYKAVEMIKQSHGIYVFSMGLTTFVADEFCLKLNLMGFKAISLTDPNIIDKFAENIDQDSLCVIFSLNGQSPEIVKTALILNSKKIQLISCTCAEQSPLAVESCVYLCGYHHDHKSFLEYEVSSRLSLSVISRLIVDYLKIVK